LKTTLLSVLLQFVQCVQNATARHTAE